MVELIKGRRKCGHTTLYSHVASGQMDGPKAMNLIIELQISHWLRETGHTHSWRDQLCFLHLIQNSCQPLCGLSHFGNYLWLNQSNCQIVGVTDSIWLKKNRFSCDAHFASIYGSSLQDSILPHKKGSTDTLYYVQRHSDLLHCCCDAHRGGHAWFQNTSTNQSNQFVLVCHYDLTVYPVYLLACRLQVLKVALDVDKHRSISTCFGW